MSSRRSKAKVERQRKYCNGFIPPNAEECAEALGSFPANGNETGGDGQPLPTTQAHFAHGDLFQHLPSEPRSDLDWLCHYEEHQSYNEFLVDVCDRRNGRFKRSVQDAQGNNNTIYLLPIGDFSGACLPDIVALVTQYVSAFYVCRVEVLQPVKISEDSDDDSSSSSTSAKRKKKTAAKKQQQQDQDESQQDGYVLWADADVYRPVTMTCDPKLRAKSSSSSLSSSSSSSSSVSASTPASFSKSSSKASAKSSKARPTLDCDDSKQAACGDADDLESDDSGSVAQMKARFDRTTGHRQLHVEPILTELDLLRKSDQFTKAHPNAACIMGITMEDLYSHDSDLFVAGMAAGGSHVAVFSLYRYQPGFQQSDADWFDHSFSWQHQTQTTHVSSKKGSTSSKRSKTTASSASAALSSSSSLSVSSTKASSSLSSLISDADADLFLRRACRLMSHELGHLFGVGHCIFYQCFMNGSGHLAEDDSQPLHACPVDLRKFHFRLRLSIPEHYSSLCSYFQSTPLLQRAFADELRFAQQCLQHVSA